MKNLQENFKKVIQAYYPDFFKKSHVDTWAKWITAITDKTEVDALIKNPKCLDIFKLRIFLAFYVPESYNENLPTRYYPFADGAETTKRFPYDSYREASKEMKSCFFDCLMLWAKGKQLSGWRIITLFKLLSYEEQSKLFNYFIPYNESFNGEDGYDTTLGSLLCNIKIPLEFKRKATSFFYDMIKKQITKNEDYFSAYYAFSRSMEMVIEDGKILFEENSYDVELLKHQLLIGSEIEKIKSKVKREDDSQLRLSSLKKVIPVLFEQQNTFEMANFCLQLIKDHYSSFNYKITAKTQVSDNFLKTMESFYLKFKDVAEDKKLLSWFEKLIENNKSYKKKVIEEQRIKNLATVKTNEKIKGKLVKSMIA